MAIEDKQQQAGIAAPDQQLLLELESQNAAPEASRGGGGLLSDSVLAALDSYAPEASSYANSKPATGGALVGYGDSDDDDED